MDWGPRLILILPSSAAVSRLAMTRPHKSITLIGKASPKLFVWDDLYRSTLWLKTGGEQVRSERASR